MKLTLTDLRTNDPGARRRFMCPLCGAGHRVDEAHRTLAVDEAKEVWYCHRCNAGGRLGDGRPRKSDRQRAREAFVR